MFVFVKPGRRLRRFLLVGGAVTCVLVLAGKYIRFSDYRARLSRHNVEWQGLTLQVDSGYVFDVQEHKLMILRLPPDTTWNLMWLQVADQGLNAAFKRRQTWCGNHTERCRTSEDAALHRGTKCLEYKVEARTPGREVFHFWCELAASDIQAMYFGDAGAGRDYDAFREMLYGRTGDSRH
jgi:hypothetical protein